MVKRKRGGFSFLEAKRPQIQPVKRMERPQNGILIVNTLITGLLEKKRNEILSVVMHTIDKSFLSGTIYEKIGRVETLYIILNMEMNTSETIKDLKNLFGYAKRYINVENKHLFLTNKIVEPIIGSQNEEISNSNIEAHIERKNTIDKKKPKCESQNNEKESNSDLLGKKMRIDINMDDIDEFFDYLENRVPERQTRNRYVENIKSLHANGWNQYRHSTFIDDNKYKVNSKEIEVFVNGMKSRDFNVSVKEYEDALELYLSYRWTKDYSKPIMQDKDDAIPPQIKKRPKKQKKIEKEEVDGKKIFVNIEHLDSWKSSKNNEDSVDPETLNTSKGVVYLGEPEGQRKSASIQNASITEKEEVVEVSINLNEQPKIEPIENGEESTEKKQEPIEVEKEPKIDNKKPSICDKPKRSMGWFARMMLRFWVWYYKKRR